MLTHCPECNGQLSTDANTCPHCGVPVQRGQAAAPTARPVGAPVYAQPMQQQMQPMQPPPPPPPQSHFLRNCFICGCLLVILAIGAFIAVPVYMVKKLQDSVIQGAPAVTAFGQKLIPGYAPPKAYDNASSVGIDFSLFTFKAKGVILKNGDSTIAAGSILPKPDNMGDIKTQMVQGVNSTSGKNQAQTSTVLSSDDVDFVLGSGETVKAKHEVTQDQDGKKTVIYILVLDPFDTEFGWLAVMGTGPEDTFDLDGFKAFLSTLKTKK